MRNPTASILSACALTILMFSLASCGGEADLEEASAQVDRVARDVETARKRVERREDEAKKSMVALDEARQELAGIETSLSEARENVENAVSDTDLFRAVQSALLDDDSLENLAISARVAQRVVTLEGSVPSEEQKAQAEALAAEALGVATVVNQIRVVAPAAE